MGKEEELGYVVAWVDDLIKVHEYNDPQLTKGLEALKKELEAPAEKGVDKAKAVEALAKALPLVSKSMISSIDAYNKGDSITGTAELINVVSALAPMIGSLSSEAGPPGMLIGAIFSVIGQILALFAPKQPSVTEQIKNLLLEIEADGIAKDVESVHDSIRTYARGLRDQADETKKALKERKLTTAQEALAFQGKIDSLIIAISEFHLIDGPTTLKNWEIANWLKREDRQSQVKWPEILCIFCQAYIDLLTSYITVLSFANSADMHAARVEVSLDNKACTLDDTHRDHVEQVLLRLTTYTDRRLKDLKSCNRTMLEKLEALAPAARDRGMFWYKTVASSTANIHIHAGDNIRKSLPSVADYSVERTAVTMTRDNEGKLRPELHVFGVESNSNKNQSIYHGGPDLNTINYGKLNSPYTDLGAGGWKSLEAVPGFHSPADIWATAGKNLKELYFYTAKEKEIYGYLIDPANSRAVDSAAAKLPVYHKTVKQNLASIRVVRSPISLPEDPDGPKIPGILKDVDSITYAGLKSSTEIYVDAKGTEGYVPGPTGWGHYTGIGVDQNYLWVYAWSGPACATHASVLKCMAERLSGNMTTPRWIQNQIPQAVEHVYEGHGDVPKGKTRYAHQMGFSADPPAPKGLVDFSPCDDGSLFAAVYKRSAEKQWALAPGDYWAVMDTLGLYTGVHQVDLKKGSMDVTWSVISDNTGVRLQKLPLYCWPLFANLMAQCKSTGVTVGAG